MKRLIQKCIEHPIRFTVIGYVIYNLLFNYVELHCTGADIHLIHSDLDRLIPFCKYAVIPYTLWFGMLAAVYAYFIFFESRKNFWRMNLTLLGGMLGTAVFYFFVKTGLNIRPAYVEGHDLCAWMVRFMWRHDTPQNVCPSIHVLTTVGMYLCLMDCPRIREHRFAAIAIRILSISIILSTLLLKQHSVVDVCLGFLVGTALHSLADYAVMQKWKAEENLRKAQIRAL